MPGIKMSATVIKDFLVALNWKTDEKGAKDAAEKLKNTEERANKLRLALNAMALGAVAAVVKTADEMEKLYFASQRIGASADNIRGFQNAISQMGGSAEGAIQSLESLAQKIRQSPGMEKMVQSVGVATRDANGAMRDQVDIYRDLSKQMSSMEYYRANAYSNAFGWDEATLMAVRDPAFGKNLDKYSELQKKLGMSNELAKSGKDFAYEWRELKTTLSTMGQVVMMNLGQALIPILKAINSGLQTMIGWWAGLDEGTKQFIKSAAQFVLVWLIFSRVLSVLKGMFGMLKSISKFGFGKFGDKLAALGKKVPILGKLGGFLSKIFKGLGALVGRIPVLGTLLGLVKKLGLAFMAFGWPIRLLMLLGAALYYLWEDFQIWKEGGEALFDWSSVVAGFEAIRDVIDDIIKRFAVLGKAAEALASGKLITAGKLLASAFTGEAVAGEAGGAAAGSSSGVAGTVAVAGAAAAGALGAKTIAKTALKRFPLVAAGMTGYEVGGFVNEKLVEGTSFGDKLGEIIAIGAAAVGVESAKEAVAMNIKNKAIYGGDAGPSVTEKAGKVADKVAGAVGNLAEKSANKAATLIATVAAKGSEVSKGLESGFGSTLTKSIKNTNGRELVLSDRDIEDIMKVVSTEVVPGLKGKAFEDQAAGVIDTVMNRAASGKYGGGIRKVINQRWAFSDINTPRKSAYGSVQNVPMSRVDPRLKAFVLNYLKKRAEGQDSIVGENVSYANPFYLGEASEATKAWVREVERQANATGQKFGKGKAIHVHGTPSQDMDKKPLPYRVVLGGNDAGPIKNSLVNIGQNLSLPKINSFAPPSAVLVQSSGSSGKAGDNVTINQSHKTDITINGAESPQVTANRIQQHADNVLAQMSKNAQGVLR